MPKGHEDHRSGHKKKAKYTLKERRQLKREKKQREHGEHDFNAPHPETTI